MKCNLLEKSYKTFSKIKHLQHLIEISLLRVTSGTDQTHFIFTLANSGKTFIHCWSFCHSFFQGYEGSLIKLTSKQVCIQTHHVKLVLSPLPSVLLSIALCVLS